MSVKATGDPIKDYLDKKRELVELTNEVRFLEGLVLQELVDKKIYRALSINHNELRRLHFAEKI